MANDDNDFAYQLEQEQLERQSKNKDDNKHVYRDPTDGTEYEWDPNLKAWFPRINDDFIAKYQASYGQFDADSAASTNKSDDQHHQRLEKSKSDTNRPSNDIPSTSRPAETAVEDSALRKRKHEDQQPQQQWFEIDDEHNTNVYVSNLPLDITMDEFVQLMKKCGLIMKDDKGQLKIKLYSDEHGNLKGDGRCCYIKAESVDLALNILDGYQIRSDHSIHVERAKFSMKGEYNPALKPRKKKMNRKDREKKRKQMEKLFDWRPDKLPGERPKSDKTIVIRNMFDLKTFESDPRLILDYKTDLREECEERCGDVRKVEIYDLNPDGVATVTFNDFESADKCVELMNGRFFAGRKLDAFHWDGKTKYKINETEEQIQKRIEKWDSFVGDDEGEVKNSNTIEKAKDDD